jgi:DNA-binding FadR family transcriptional regulator
VRELPKSSVLKTGSEVSELAGVQLADQLVRDLLRLKARPGTVISSEAELRALHSAGRPVFRQAVRILEERGVAHMRRGHGGGLVVSEPSADFAGRALSIVIESLSEDMTSLALMPNAVAMHLFLYSARRLKPEKCDELRRLARRLNRLSGDEFLKAGAHRRLHNALYTASGEPAAALAHRTATEYSIDLIPYSVNVSAEASKGEAWRITCDLVEALAAGDVAGMVDCRRRQVGLFEASVPQWNAINEDPGLAPKVGDPARPEFQLANSRADRLAREILREIRTKGWKPGARIGGGNELIIRYGATVTVLRQAVRTLQEHNAVEIERGRAGGLFVALPDRSRAVERAVTFLRRAGVSAPDVQALLLNITLEALDAAPPRGVDLAEILRPSQSVCFSDLPLAIGRALRCPPLELFAEILSPFLPPERRPGLPAKVVAQALTSPDRVQRRRIVLACASET